MKNYSKAGNKGGWSGQRTLSSFIIKKTLICAGRSGWKAMRKGQAFSSARKKKK